MYKSGNVSIPPVTVTSSVSPLDSCTLAVSTAGVAGTSPIGASNTDEVHWVANRKIAPSSVGSTLSGRVADLIGSVVRSV